MSDDYRVAWWRRWLARPFLRYVLRGVFHLLASIEITGRENIPYGKPYIVAINHVSLFDPPFIGVFWPEYLEAMGAAEVWNKPGQGLLAKMWGGIPVRRGEYDRAMFEKVLGALRSGSPVLIAPEGGRSHAPGMREARPGIAFLAEESGMPVLPVGIVGTTDDFWHKASRGNRPPLEMHIGAPILIPPVEGRGAERKDARQRNTDLIMRGIAALLPEEYRGVYGNDPQTGQ
jgi:1-acyl-sn-glycerol-3-phosphate acyltransferase